MSKPIFIWWRPEGGSDSQIEQIDQADSEAEARDMVRQYQLAYKGHVWSGRKKDGMGHAYH